LNFHIHLVYYTYNIYEYHDNVVLNLHASNMNASTFLHLRMAIYIVHRRCDFD